MKPTHACAVAAATALMGFIFGQVTQHKQPHSSAVLQLPITPAQASVEPVVSTASTNRPTRRDPLVVREQHIGEAAAHVTSLVVPDYLAQFHALGLTPAQSAVMVEDLQNITARSFASGQAQVDVYEARKLYDNELRELLGPDNYATYRKWEAARKDGREVDRLQAFADKAGVNLSDDALTAFRSAVREADGYVEQPTEGPYDPPFVLQYGVEALLAGFDREADRLNAARVRVTGRLSRTVTAQELSAIDGHYRQQIADVKEERARLVKESASPYPEEFLNRHPNFPVDAPQRYYDARREGR